MPGPDWMALILVAVLAIMATAAAAGLVFLSRIARGIGDLKVRMDDLKLRLGVLDPGETRVNPFAQAYQTQTKSIPPPDAPDETLPGSG